MLSTGATKALNAGLKGKTGLSKTVGQIGNFASLASGNKQLNETLFGTKRRWFDPRKYTTDKLGWTGQKGLVNQTLGNDIGRRVEAATNIGNVVNAIGNKKGFSGVNKFNVKDNDRHFRSSNGLPSKTPKPVSMSTLTGQTDPSKIAEASSNPLNNTANVAKRPTHI
jgi:hypothetical protein